MNEFQPLKVEGGGGCVFINPWWRLRLFSVAEITKRYARYRPNTMKKQSEVYDLVRGVLDN